MKNKKIANELRKELLSGLNLAPSKSRDIKEVEYISKTKYPFSSPIFTMSEDEALNFVENTEVTELSALSVAELNRLGEILGVEPSILTQGVN